MARPTKLTPEVAEKILKSILAGSSIGAACGYAGVHPSTFYRWMERGDSSGRRRADAPYRNLRAQVEQARAEAQVRLEALVNKAAEGDWHAARWLLSCRNPELYGSKPVAEVLPGPASEESGELDPRFCTSEERLQVIQIMEAAQARKKDVEQPG